MNPVADAKVPGGDHDGYEEHGPWMGSPRIGVQKKLQTSRASQRQGDTESWLIMPPPPFRS